MKPGMSSTPTDLDGLRGLIALKISESETGAKDQNSDIEKVWKKTGQRLLGFKFSSTSIDFSCLNLSDLIVALTTLR
jgi:hypothetical protein